MKSHISLILTLLLFQAIIAMGQDNSPTPPGSRSPTSSAQARDRDFESRSSDLSRLMNQIRERSQERIKRLSKEERKRFEEATSPSEQLVEEYKDLLKRSDTGIFRLLPNFDCQTDKLVKLDGNCAGFVPDAWAYSFRSEDYSGEDFHDIKFVENRIETDSLLNQGILVKLGKTGIGVIGLEHQGLSYLRSFIPAADRQGATTQLMQLSAGIESDGFYVSNSLRVEVGNTYAYRGISYRYGDKWASRFRGRNHQKLSKEEYKFARINFDKRIDSIYVFSVVAEDEDRGVTIVWKRLVKNKSPKMVFEENEKLRDF